MSSRPRLERGDVVLIVFPFTDLRGQKLRPALVLAPSSADDVIVAFITSQVSPPPGRSGVVLGSGDPELAAAGLKAASSIRLDKLATLDRALAVRRLGRIGPSTQAAVDAALRHVFQLKGAE